MLFPKKKVHRVTDISAAYLKEQGIDIGRDIYTVKYAASCVMEKMKKYNIFAGGEKK